MNPSISRSIIPVLGLLVTTTVNAQPAPAATPAPSPTPVRKSSFTTHGVARNPFWPVGWAPGVKKPVEQVTIGPEYFKVTAILLGPPHLAVINGKDYAEGDSISVPVGGKEEKVRIDAVRDGFILLNHRGRPITVPMNRAAQPKSLP
jgi:hypothetical protein